MSFVLSVYVTEVKETAVKWTFWKYCVHTDVIIGPFINEFFSGSWWQVQSALKVMSYPKVYQAVDLCVPHCSSEGTACS